MSVDFAVTNQEDITWVGRHMRADDVREVAASGDRNPQNALLASVNASRESFTAFVDGEPVAIFGVAGGTLMRPVVSPAD